MNIHSSQCVRVRALCVCACTREECCPHTLKNQFSNQLFTPSTRGNMYFIMCLLNLNIQTCLYTLTTKHNSECGSEAGPLSKQTYHCLCIPTQWAPSLPFLGIFLPLANNCQQAEIHHWQRKQWNLRLRDYFYLNIHLNTFNWPGGEKPRLPIK